ncbi:MAG: plasmid mobilization relaxosome protein MobC [Ruminococcus sp.]|nr:plasmid mobilization relaxosome protein MobC [Ruminococcus sp.]
MDNRKRNKTLSIRLTEAEKNKIINKAKKSKMTVTDYVVSLSDKMEIKLPPDLSPVVVEMKRLGNNLNKIAMKLNSGVVYTPDFKSVLDNQKVIYEMIYKLSEKN